MEELEFELKVRISPSDNEFRKLIGIIEYEKLTLTTFKRDKISCKGCGYKPLDDSNAAKSLALHVVAIDLETPLNSPCLTLCKACHSTQHIDIAIEKDWVQLVNSLHTQKRLIELCRVNAVQNNLNTENTRFLKTSALTYLENLRSGMLSPNSRVKVIFTTKFEWGDL